MALSRGMGKGKALEPGFSIQWNHHRVFKETNEKPWKCDGCGEEVPEDALVVHHRDDNHDNDAPENLGAMHWGCHTRHHHLGVTRDIETRRNLRDAHIGNAPTEETLEKLSKALKGRPWTEARRRAHEEGTSARRARRAELDR